MAKNQFKEAHFTMRKPLGAGLKPPAGRTVLYAPIAAA